MLKEIILETSFESTFEQEKSFLDIETHLDGFVTLKMEYNSGMGFDIDEDEWNQINKRVKQLFKQLK